jgi:hypothetical protein
VEDPGLVNEFEKFTFMEAKSAVGSNVNTVTLRYVTVTWRLQPVSAGRGGSGTAGYQRTNRGGVSVRFDTKTLSVNKQLITACYGCDLRIALPAFVQRFIE